MVGLKQNEHTEVQVSTNRISQLNLQLSQLFEAAKIEPPSLQSNKLLDEKLIAFKHETAQNPNDPEIIRQLLGNYFWKKFKCFWFLVSTTFSIFWFFNRYFIPQRKTRKYTFVIILCLLRLLDFFF